jgi:hypothetical protein
LAISAAVGHWLGRHIGRGALILLVWLPGLSGCRAPVLFGNHGFMPLGIYAVNSTNDFAAVKAAGFNLVTGPADRAYLDAARRQGLKVLASPNTSAGPGFQPASAREAIRQFDDHPALWAWYLIDEPDLNQISPDQVKHAQRFVKSLAAAKPTALVIFQGYEARDYANIADLLMVDRYPIPWLPLANFGQHVQLARLALPPNKPLIAVIQAFDWSWFPELLPGERNLRPPTKAELRCMTYDALARGANGLFYYAYDDGRWKIREHPETWDALTRVVAEVNARRPLFQAERIWWAKSAAFADPAHRFNAALESSITSCLLHVRKGNAAIPAGNYVLAVNNTEWTQTYSFSAPERRPKAANERQKTEKGGGTEEGAKKTEERSGEGRKPAAESQEEPVPSEPPATELHVPVVGEHRAVAVRMGRVTDEFGPYSIHVYGPLR